MDPNALVDITITPGLPAPFWLIQALKLLGFILHEVPMNLWFAGILWSMVLAAAGNPYGRRFSSRLMAQMPVIIALGINFGIVPLLFIQVAYSKFFYPATILMAWFWLAIIALLIPAYYGIYIYAFGLADNARTMRRWKRIVGWTAAGVFLVIGFLFANALSLTANAGRWPLLWERTQVGGAALGLALNWGDPQVWPRWLMMFGIAQMTTAAWLVLDAAWFGRGETDDYRRWAGDFAWRLYTIGFAWYAVTAAWYMFGTWSSEILREMWLSPWAVLTLATGAAPAGAWIILYRARRQGTSTAPRWAAAAAAAQFGVVVLNASARQVVQNLEIERYFDLSGQPVDAQWGSLGLFVASLVVGVAVIAWMLLQLRIAGEPATQPPMPE